MADRQFRTITDWQRQDPALGDAIRAFWVREHANVEGDEATRRLTQVVAHVVDETGDLAAVATVTPRVLPRLGQPMYYYRCFVGEAWRSTKLVLRLLRQTQKVLEAYARSHDFPCIGILLELENPGFAYALRWANWPGLNFAYIGISPRRLELRVWYFRGAQLKTPDQMARFVLAAQPSRQLRAAGRAMAREPGG
ncbi:MAG: hypothetical protein ACREP0_13725 [Rhodanobacteraceae bacterium]